MHLDNDDACMHLEVKHKTTKTEIQLWLFIKKPDIEQGLILIQQFPFRRLFASESLRNEWVYGLGVTRQLLSGSHPSTCIVTSQNKCPGLVVERRLMILMIILEFVYYCLWLIEPDLWMLVMGSDCTVPLFINMYYLSATRFYGACCWWWLSLCYDYYIQ